MRIFAIIGALSVVLLSLVGCLSTDIADLPLADAQPTVLFFYTDG